MAGSTTRARYRMGESEDFTWNSEVEHILSRAMKSAPSWLPIRR